MSKLRKVLHAVGHVIWIGAQYANVASSVVPAKYKPLVASALTIISAIHGYFVAKQVHNG